MDTVWHGTEGNSEQLSSQRSNSEASWQGFITSWAPQILLTFLLWKGDKSFRRRRLPYLYLKCKGLYPAAVRFHLIMTTVKVQDLIKNVKVSVPGESLNSVNIVHGTFRCRRGYDLYTTTYQPMERRTDACLVFHHGLADHSERHREVLAHLCSSLGMPVYTYDAHGHGLSGPDGPSGRALILSYRHMVDDLLDFTRIFVTKAEEGIEAPAVEASPLAPACPGIQPFRGKPRVFLLGYSMGGLVSSLAVAETCPATPSSEASMSSSSPLLKPSTNPKSPGKAAGSAGDATSVDAASAAVGKGGAVNGGGSSLYEGLMLTSCLTDPLFGNHIVLRAIKVVYVTTLSWLVPRLPMFKRNPVESGIRDPAAARAMADDLLWYRGRFKVATVASLLAACSRLRRNARRLSAVPLYVQHATIDMSCSLPSMHAFLARVLPVDLTMHVVEGAYHDLHHDPETPMLLGRMLEWLRKRV